MTHVPGFSYHQAQLAKMGLYTGPLDDDIGPGTELALRKEHAIAFRALGIAGPRWPTLPPRIAWLNDIGDLPNMLEEMVDLYGVLETPGSANTPAIMRWPGEINEKFPGAVQGYTGDSIAWCGLAQAKAAVEAGWDIAPVGNVLGSRNWQKFGVPVPIGHQVIGDVGTFWRGSRAGWQGHVGMLLGEDDSAYHILGGNTNDAIEVARLTKDRLLEFRRAPYRNPMPANWKLYRLRSDGPLSTNEA